MNSVSQLIFQFILTPLADFTHLLSLLFILADSRRSSHIPTLTALSRRCFLRSSHSAPLEILRSCTMIKIVSPNLLTLPLILQSHEENETNTLIDPFNETRETISSPEMQGKRCFGSIGTHLFLFDPKTKECFFLDRVSMSKISLPVMPYDVAMFGSMSLSSSLSCPDCAVIFTGYTVTPEREIENFIVFCRLNDEKWTKISVELGDLEIFAGSSVVQCGKLYVPCSGDIVVFDIPSLINGGIIEKKIIMAPEVPYYPVVNTNTRHLHLVESVGEFFMVRIYLHNATLVYVDIHRLLHDNNNIVWERVDTIGERAFFLEETRCTSATAKEVGVERNCIYSVLDSGGGCVHKFSLDDKTTAVRSLLGKMCWSDEESIFCWLVVPSRHEGIIESVAGLADLVLKEELPQISEDIEEMKADVYGPWSNLPIDILKFLLTKVSLVDVINIRAVCKAWNSIPNPFAKTQTWPWLMYHAKADGTCRFFDPVNLKMYSIKIEKLCLNAQNDRVVFLCSRNGWVLALIDDRKLVIINPFCPDKTISSPPLSGVFKFDAVAFSSVPTSPDCIVFGINSRSKRCMCRVDIEIGMWRPGLKEETWDKMTFKNEAAFRLARTNPVFVNGDFYCLGEEGEIGVFNPKNRTWKVLDIPESICYSSVERKCYLLEFGGYVSCVIKLGDGEDTIIGLCLLNQTNLTWCMVLDPADVLLFLEPKGSVARWLPNKRFHNYEGWFQLVYDSEERKTITIDMEKFNLKEPIDCLWLEPNMDN